MNRPETTPRWALTADRLFDGQRLRPGHAVLIGGEQVIDVVPIAELPDDANLSHHPGCTILPGLIDMHIHFMRWQGPVYLAYGVTTVRDTGNDLDWILDCRSRWRDELWPRLLCLGPLLDGVDPGHAVVSRAIYEPDQGVEVVRETAAAGVDGIKLYHAVGRDCLGPMIRATHDAGLKASMHCWDHGVLYAAEAELDEFYHLDGILEDVWPNHPPGWLEVWGDPGLVQTSDAQQRVADEIAARRLTSTPTLAYWESMSRLRLEPHAPHEQAYAPRTFLQCVAHELDPQRAQTWRRGLDAALVFTGLLHQRGTPTLAGTDAPFAGILPGQSLWREMALLEQAGLSPLEALRAATADAADFLEQPRLGRLRPDAAADLVIVRDDPTRSIPIVPHVELILRTGTPHRPDDLLSDVVEDDTWPQDPWGRQFLQHVQR